MVIISRISVSPLKLGEFPCLGSSIEPYNRAELNFKLIIGLSGVQKQRWRELMTTQTDLLLGSSHAFGGVPSKSWRNCQLRSHELHTMEVLLTLSKHIRKTNLGIISYGRKHGPTCVDSLLVTLGQLSHTRSIT